MTNGSRTSWHVIWRANEGRTRNNVRGDARQVKQCVPCRGENLEMFKFFSQDVMICHDEKEAQLSPVAPPEVSYCRGTTGAL